MGGEGYGLIAPSQGHQGREVSVGGGYGLFTVGCRFRHSEDGGLQVGLRAGYLLSPCEADWRVDDRRLSNAPGAPLQRPFVRVLLGGGGECSDSRYRKDRNRRLLRASKSTSDRSKYRFSQRPTERTLYLRSTTPDHILLKHHILYQMLRITIQVERLLAVESYRPRNAAPHVQPSRNYRVDRAA